MEAEDTHTLKKKVCLIFIILDKKVKIFILPLLLNLMYNIQNNNNQVAFSTQNL